MTRRSKLVLALSSAAVALLGGFGACGRVQTFAAPAAPVTSISNAEYQSLLQKYVGGDGRVDYARWKDDAADVRALDGYLSTVTHATPDTRLELFATQPERLSYWINLYNALVLREILRRWPLDSVTDVKVNVTSYVKAGKGFFYDLEFAVGGQKLNLYDIENKILRAQFKDARIHFAINCGSASCPLLKRDAFDSSALEGQLEAASTAFVNDGKNVRVDDAKRQIVLSKLFDWYKDDFVAFAKQRAKVEEAGLVDFALLYAAPPLATKLRDARAKKYEVVFLDYDWNVNKGSFAGALAGERAPAFAKTMFGVGAPVPDVAFKLASGEGTISAASLRGKVVLVDFWATFCKPCKASFPELQALSERHKDQGLVIVGVSEDDEPQKVVPAFLVETGAKFIIATDAEQSAAGPLFRVSAMPTELLVDRRGVVRYRHEGLGEGEMDQIAKELEALLGEP